MTLCWFCLICFVKCFIFDISWSSLCGFVAIGAVPSPFDCFLVNRGIKTLAIRMQQHMANGLAIARYLEKSSKVTKVIHPGN